MKLLDMDPIAVSIPEAARLLGVSTPTMYRWSRLPGFPLLKIGGCTRVLVDELRHWAKEQVKTEGGDAY